MDSVILDPETFRLFLGDVPDMKASWFDDLVRPQDRKIGDGLFAIQPSLDS
jgi:hypothetical protein